MSSNFVFPFPFPVHLIFVIVGTVFFLLQFYRKRSLYYLLLSVGILSTMLIYVCSTGVPYILLGLEELALFVLILIYMRKTHKEAEQREKQEALQKYAAEFHSRDLQETEDHQEENEHHE